MAKEACRAFRQRKRVARSAGKPRLPLEFPQWESFRVPNFAGFLVKAQFGNPTLKLVQTPEGRIEKLTFLQKGEDGLELGAGRRWRRVERGLAPLLSGVGAARRIRPWLVAAAPDRKG